MEVELTLENVGGLRGKHKFEFERGAVTLAEGSNTAGKSSLVKGLVSVLSVPPDGDFSEFANREARALGVRTEEKSAREGFVNVHEDAASAELRMDGQIAEYSVTRDGKIKTLPEIGNEGFLMAGVLSKDCKVMRQLQEGDDDFAWAVTKLSLAQYYDQIKDGVLTRREDAAERARLIADKMKRLSKISADKEKLEKDLQKVSKEVEALQGRAEKVKGLLVKRKKASDTKIDLQAKIGNIEGAMAKTKRELDEHTKTSNKLASRIASLSEKIDAARKKAGADENVKRSDQLEKEVDQLIDERTKLEGILNLFVTAQSSVKGQKGDGACPLCENGRISEKQIEKKLSSLRAEKEEINGRIVKLNKERTDLLSLSTRIEQEVLGLQKEKKAAETEKVGIESLVKSVGGRLKNQTFEFDDYSKRIKQSEAEIESLSKLSPGEDQKVMDEFDKKDAIREDISYKLRKIAEELADSAEVVEGKTLPLERAKVVFDRFVAVLDDMIGFSDGRAKEHRETARTRFNQNVNELLGELKFKEFRTVKLNEDYRLYVERRKGTSNDYVLQQVKTLSGSEKMAIAIILELALKETYIPGLPFFVLDDVVVEFDDDRKKTVIDYLRRIAKEKDWSVIVTNLDETKRTLTLRTLKA